MPYCPKCDMEFVDGITVCTDCGGPLAESEEASKAMKKQEKESAMKRQQAMMEELMRASKAQIQQAKADASDNNADNSTTDSAAAEALKAAAAEAAAKAYQPTKVYVDKSQKYEDLKSSASAFLIVGGLLLVFSVLCWAGIINLPMYGLSRMIFQGTLTAMGIFSMVVFVKSSKSAKELAPEIDVEKHQTEEIIDWFLNTYSAKSIDGKIPYRSELSDEELSLKRFQLIQDYLITGKDLPDQSYVDLLSEEIYTKLYES